MLSARSNLSSVCGCGDYGSSFCFREGNQVLLVGGIDSHDPC